MDRRCRPVRRCFVLVVVVTMLLSTSPLAGKTPADQRVTVELGKPSLWTLEQAHYQLARMHKVNDGLKSKFPDDTDLDPIATHGRRLDLLQTLIRGEVAFDQSAGIQNRLNLQKTQHDLTRRATVRSQLDGARTQLIAVSQEISALELEVARMRLEGKGDDDVKPLVDAIAAKTQTKALLEAQISAMGTELTSLASTTVPDFKSPFPASGNGGEGGSGSGGLGNPVVGELAKEIFKNAGEPKLHASRVLDNHIQLQYEIIAKQLTLLRDEIGHEKRLIFLELPQSIYTVPKKADGYLVRTEWKVAAYYPPPDSEHCDKEAKAGEPRRDDNSEPDESRNQKPKSFLNACDFDNRIEIPDDAYYWDTSSYKASSPERGRLPAAIDARVVDLIPRTSALNVNATHGQLKGMSFAAKAAWFFGLGAGASFERRREKLEQFMQQELFTAAYGKGKRIFGWTFAPFPGEKRVAPGIKTTYAVVVVPREAVGLELEGRSCTFKRKVLPPDAFRGTPSGAKPHQVRCSIPDTFSLEIPHENISRFWVDDIEFASVDKGKRATVFLRGTNFSSQVGVVVNGVPLARVPSVADHVLSTGAPPSHGIHGVYEIVNSEDLIMSFAMGASFVGTPVISLVTPQKVHPINHFDDTVKFKDASGATKKLSLAEYTRDHGPMFRELLDVDDIEIFNGGGTYRALVAGTGFRAEKVRVLINGAEACGPSSSPCDVDHSRHIGFAFSPNPPSDPDWTVTVVHDSTMARHEASTRIPNPLLPIAEEYEILRHVPCKRDAKGKVITPERLDVVLHGHNLDRAITVKEIAGSKAKVTSFESLTPESYYVAIESPDNPTLLRLERSLDPLGTETLAALATVYPLQAPRILSLARDGTAKPTGPKAGKYAVVIRGENLANVRRVRFGAQLASSVRADDNVVHAVAPPGDGPVQVLLETDVFYKGRPLTNAADLEDPKHAVFTFKDPPKKNEQNGGGKK